MEIHSFSWGASNPSTIGAGGGGAGGARVSVSSFNVMKRTDAASPILFQACCKGDHFAKAARDPQQGRRATAALDFLKYEFEEVYVDSVQWSGSSGGDDTPDGERLVLASRKVSITYTPQKPRTVQGRPRGRRMGSHHGRVRPEARRAARVNCAGAVRAGRLDEAIGGAQRGGAGRSHRRAAPHIPLRAAVLRRSVRPRGEAARRAGPAGQRRGDGDAFCTEARSTPSG